MGDWDHSRLQFALLLYLGTREREWDIYVVGECRL